MEFVPFPKIDQMKRAQMTITQKLHGTNAQIHVFKNDDHIDLRCGSRSRWIIPGDDNFGFAKFVYDNKEEFIEKLGIGTHFGEWCGPGINSGEGLKEKTFFLFDHWKWPPERALPPGTRVVPVLYNGPFDLKEIDKTMDFLREVGSIASPGFMRPEGVVIRFLGERFKMVFDNESTSWKDADPVYREQKEKQRSEVFEKYGHLFQPKRLEKLLSRDEKYTREFPKSMPIIVDDYFSDLVTEGEVGHYDNADELFKIKKVVSGELFKFVKKQMEIEEWRSN